MNLGPASRQKISSSSIFTGACDWFQARARGYTKMNLLDIGGGVGAIEHELLESGVQSATDVDASKAYLRAAREEAQRRGLAERVSYQHGNFVDLAAQVPDADIVTLDRVICCYDDMEKLVDLSAARARRFYGLVYPRDTWLARLAVKIINLFFRLRTNRDTSSKTRARLRHVRTQGGGSSPGQRSHLRKRAASGSCAGTPRGQASAHEPHPTHLSGSWTIPLPLSPGRRLPEMQASTHGAAVQCRHFHTHGVPPAKVSRIFRGGVFPGENCFCPREWIWQDNTQERQWRHRSGRKKIRTPGSPLIQ